MFVYCDALGMLLNFRKAKNFRLVTRVFFTLFTRLATFRVFGSQYSKTKIEYSLNDVISIKFS